MSPEDLLKAVCEAFPKSLVEIHWSFILRPNGYVPPHVMVSVTSKPGHWVHAFIKPDEPKTAEQLIAELERGIKFWAELGNRPPLVSRLPRQVIQLELEATLDQGPNLFEVTLRNLLETQLGSSKVTTERVNRYLSMSRGKMYLLLEGVGCKKEQLEQLRKLDV